MKYKVISDSKIEPNIDEPFLKNVDSYATNIKREFFNIPWTLKNKSLLDISKISFFYDASFSNYDDPTISYDCFSGENVINYYLHFEPSKNFILKNPKGNKSMSNESLIQTENYNIDGVPGDFVTSFGGYVGLKFFLTGVDQKKNVYTYNNKDISEQDFELIKNEFDQCRTIYSSSSEEYEFYKKDFGYILVDKNIAVNSYKISTGLCFDELNDVIKDMGQNIEKCPKASWVTGVDQHGDLVIKEISIKSIYDYNHNLYPFMNGKDMKTFVEEYIKSKSSILILIGPPGTSKTNFIRQLLSSAQESVLLTYSDDLKKADSLFSHFYDSPEKFLVVEDADTYISKRTGGNSNMKQLLNITDGLTANPDKKVIFTTNLPNISNVDDALLRPGRCYTVLKFDRLKDDDLARAANSISDDLYEKLDHTTEYTVAELYAVYNGETREVEQTESAKTKSFGFSL